MNIDFHTVFSLGHYRRVRTRHEMVLSRKPNSNYFATAVSTPQLVDNKTIADE